MAPRYSNSLGTIARADFVCRPCYEPPTSPANTFSAAGKWIPTYSIDLANGVIILFLVSFPRYPAAPRLAPSLRLIVLNECHLRVIDFAEEIRFRLGINIQSTM